MVAACLGLTALTILGPTELAAFDQSAWLFPLIVAGPLIVGLVLTLLMRNPWPPLAALGVFAVWPPWWILVAAGLWRLGAIVGLLWCVSVATAIRMALTRRRLKALLGRDA